MTPSPRPWAGVLISLAVAFPALQWAADHESVTCDGTRIESVRNGGLYLLTAVAAALPAALAVLVVARTVRVVAALVAVALVAVGAIGHAVLRVCFII